jgi:threonine dehydrogenase-like Zn-dependent dehydrogenase
MQHFDRSHAEPFEVKVEERPLPTIKHPDDVLVKITTAAICGSDLHMYRGRTGAQGGIIFGTNLIELQHDILLMI